MVRHDQQQRAKARQHEARLCADSQGHTLYPQADQHTKGAEQCTECEDEIETYAIKKTAAQKTREQPRDPAISTYAVLWFAAG